MFGRRWSSAAIMRTAFRRSWPLAMRWWFPRNVVANLFDFTLGVLFFYCVRYRIFLLPSLIFLTVLRPEFVPARVRQP